MKNHEFKTEEDYYIIGKSIGKGAFSTVYVGIHILTGKYVAIKCIKRNSLNETLIREKVMEEINLIKLLNNRNVIYFLEFFENKNGIYMVFELVKGGDLFSYIRAKGQINENACKPIFRQILNGLHYCHMNNILHRDIKLENILINLNNEIKVI